MEDSHTFEKLKAELKKRSRKTLKRFGKVSVSGINHKKLLMMLAEVEAYWEDYLRPALTSLSCEAVGGYPEATEDVSLMITLMGAGLGIHDDIIDKSLNKHFRSTILGLHGMDNALLVGELLVVKALTQVRKIVNKCDPKKIEHIIDVYESFFLEVWEGEFKETLCRRKLDTKLEDYEEILWMSTADTAACTKLGGILGGGTKVEIKILTDFGRRLGFIFRLADEVKDSLNREGNLPSRLENESVPLPILYAAKASEEISLKIKSVLEKSTISSADANMLLNFCFDTNAFNYMTNMAEKNAKKAMHELRVLKKSAAREMLELLGKYALSYMNSFFSESN